MHEFYYNYASQLSVAYDKFAPQKNFYRKMHIKIAYATITVGYEKKLDCILHSTLILSEPHTVLQYYYYK